MFIALVTSSISSYAVHRVGNGGHSVASHFSTVANNIARVWEDICLNKKDSNAYCSYLKDYQDSLNKDSLKYINITAVDEFIGEDYKTKHPCKIANSIREACNDGQNRIIVNATKWRKIGTNVELVNLVLHEFFSVLELDTSDHYEYSIKVYSMLKHKGIDLNLLATHENLPTPCSIKIIEKTHQSNLKSLLVSNLVTKRYKIKNEIETTRYKLNLASKCQEATFKVSCAVFAELEDTYTKRKVFSGMQIKTGQKSKTKQLFRIMQNSINAKIATCNM